MSPLLFCYGTLTCPTLIGRLLGRRMRPIPARLAGYRRATLRGRPYPGIWPQPQAVTDGCCYRLRHRRELKRLDRYEGRQYRRRRLIVLTRDGPDIAWVYLPAAAGYAAGAPWSQRAFVRRLLPHYRRRIRRWGLRRIARPGDHGA